MLCRYIIICLFHLSFSGGIPQPLKAISGFENLKFSSSLTSFIIGGHKSPKRNFYVSILGIINGTKQHVCGGTIVHEEWVLTAAHCVIDRNPDDILIVTGGFTNETAAKTEVKIHEISVPTDYRETLLGWRLHDIALVKVRDFQFPSESVLLPCMYSPEYCTVLGTCGLGLTNRNNLTSYSTTLKEILLYERQPSCWRRCSEDLVCTTQMSKSRVDKICFGDSGGPLYVIGEFPDSYPICLYGVTSHGGRLVLGTSDYNLGRFPLGGSYFSNVPYFFNWIASTMIEFYEERGLPVQYHRAPGAQADYEKKNN